jgi:hypothetical protein
MPFTSIDTVVKARAPDFELSANLEYMDQVVYSGRDYGIKQYAAIPTIQIKHRSGIWLGTVGYYLSSVGDKNLIAKQDFVIGVQRQIFSWLNSSVSCSRWRYHGRSQEELKFTFDYFISNYNSVKLGNYTVSPQFYWMIGNHQRSKVVQGGIGISRYFYKGFTRYPNISFGIEPTYVIMSSTVSKNDAVEPPTWLNGKKIELINHEVILPVTYQQKLVWNNHVFGDLFLTPTWHGTLAVNARPNDGAPKTPFGYWTVNCKYVLGVQIWD